MTQDLIRACPFLTFVGINLSFAKDVSSILPVLCYIILDPPISSSELPHLIHILYKIIFIPPCNWYDFLAGYYFFFLGL